MEEAQRYTTQTAQTEREMSAACLGLLTADGACTANAALLLLDLGTGSGLSASILREAGHECIGVDVAWNMLTLAQRDQIGMPLVHHDLGHGLPLRSGCCDGAISVATLQWICDDAAALARFLAALARVLKPASHAILQFYPTPDGAEATLSAARAAGFVRAELLIDMPHATRAKKLMLALQAAPTAGHTGGHCDVTTTCATCPLAWPMPASCSCRRSGCCSGAGQVGSSGSQDDDGGHRSKTSIAAFPAKLRGCACCDDDDDGTRRHASKDWHDRLRAACLCAPSRCEPWANEAAVRGSATSVQKTSRDAAANIDAPRDQAVKEMLATRAASISRLQHHHMKYVRRALHTLGRHCQQQPPPPPPPPPSQQQQSGTMLDGRKQREQKRARTSSYATSARQEAPILKGGSLDKIHEASPVASLYIGGDGCSHSGSPCERCMLLQLRGRCALCKDLCDALVCRLARAGLQLEHADTTTTEGTTEDDAHDVEPGFATTISHASECVVRPLIMEGLAPHGYSQFCFSCQGAEGAVSGDWSAPAGRAARILLELLTRLLRAGLVASAFDVTVRGAGGEGTASTYGTMVTCVAVALRARHSSGGSNTSAQDTGGVAPRDPCGWTPVLREAIVQSMQCAPYE